MRGFESKSVRREVGSSTVYMGLMDKFSLSVVLFVGNGGLKM
jgi:hypothetical protein